MRRQFYALVAVLTTLFGCATAPPAQVEAKRTEFARTVPTCRGDADCKAKWEAAQLWVVHNAGYKIQTATEVLIETYNPGPSDARIAARVTKEPNGAGSYKIVVFVWCNNIFGCVPNSWDAALDFNRRVGWAGLSSTQETKIEEPAWTLAYKDTVNRHLLLSAAASRDSAALLKYADRACGPVAPCEVRFWDKASLVPTTSVRSAESEAAVVAVIFRDQSGTYKQGAAGAQSGSAPSSPLTSTAPPESGCFKEVFNRFCLGGALSQEEAGAATKVADRGRSGVSYLYSEGKDMVTVVVLDGAIALVTRSGLGGTGSWIEYDEMVARVTEANGPGVDESRFPSYANDQDSRATSISVGSGQATHLWRFDHWEVLVTWNKEGVLLVYRVPSLVAKLRAAEGY